MAHFVAPHATVLMAHFMLQKARLVQLQPAYEQKLHENEKLNEDLILLRIKHAMTQQALSTVVLTRGPVEDPAYQGV